MDWRIWDKDSAVEARTYKRTIGELPEMECSKQLRELVSTVYKSGNTILDVGCASGHYYNSLAVMDQNIQYAGIDATDDYIKFAKEHFKGNQNTKFEQGDIFDGNFFGDEKFDIVFCANVILHLPEAYTPFQKLLDACKGTVFVRTLISDKTHLSRFLYDDEGVTEKQPVNFVYQNTYSSDYITKISMEFGAKDVKFIEDSFDERQINKEYVGYSTEQSAVTRVLGGKQIAGSKVFEWRWVQITK